MEYSHADNAPKRKIVIIGAGGHGRVCADVARRAGYAVSAFCDPAFEQVSEILGVEVLSHSERELFENWPDDTQLVIGIGDNTRRLSIAGDAARHGVPLAVLVDPSAIVSPSAHLGEGAVIMPGAVVNAEAFVGRASLVNSAAVVEHGARVGEGAHIGPGACLTGDTHVGARTLVGARATLVPGVRTGDDAIIGAGAVVTREAGDGARLMGVPARTVRHLKLVSTD